MHNNSYADRATNGIFGLLIREEFTLYYEEMKGGLYTMNGLKIARLVLQGLTLLVSVGSAVVSGKELSVKVAEEVAKQLADKQ